MTRYEEMDELVVLLNLVNDKLRHQNRKLDDIMATQAELDAATTALTVMTNDVATNVATLQTDVAAIQAIIAQPTLDATALDAAVAAAANTAANLDSAVSSVTALVPAQPTPVVGS